MSAVLIMVGDGFAGVGIGGGGVRVGWFCRAGTIFCAIASSFGSSCCQWHPLPRCTRFIWWALHFIGIAIESSPRRASPFKSCCYFYSSSYP